MATKYIVEYIQVNINVGDCEIILLLEEKGGKKSIKYSVMVDGGMGHSMPMANIRRRVFPDIERKYVPQGTFQLDAIVITHWDEDHYGGILKFLKDPWYISGGKTKNPLKNKGQTRLYVPYQWGYGIDFDGLHVIWKNDQFGFEDKNKKELFICKYRADTPGKRRKQLEHEPVAWDFDENKSQLIGRNLFTDSRPILSQGDAANPTALVGAHAATMPGLYCVAANNQFLGVGDGSGGGDKSNKNRSSIVCMIIHPDGTVSHYLAGDAHQELEAKVIEWTGLKAPTDLSKPIDKVDDKDRIAIVKASHHGSFTATPIEMCQTYKPKYFVFSAGNLHRHPMWEVLLYVCSYCQSLGKNISPSGVWMTSFPYWMRQGVEHFLPTEEPQPRVERYRETIKEFFDDLEPEHIRKLYKLVKKAKDKADAITAAKILGKPAEEDSAKIEKDKIEQKIRRMFKSILDDCSTIRNDDYVFPSDKLTSHVSYISFLLDGTPVVVRIGPGFDRLKTTVTRTKRPGSPGDGAPRVKR